MDQASSRNNEESINSATRLSQPEPARVQDQFSGLRADPFSVNDGIPRRANRERSESFRQEKEENEPGRRRQRELKPLALNHDGQLQNDEENLYDFAGFDYNIHQPKPKLKQSKVQDENQNYSSQTSCADTTDELLVQIIEQTLQVYHVSEKLAPLEVIGMISPEELTIYKEEVIAPMLQLHPHLVKHKVLDLGNYPLNPWLDTTIAFQSQIDEIHRGSQFQEGTYDLVEQPIRGTHEVQTVKVFLNNFEIPDDDARLQTVKFTDCTSALELSQYDLQDNEFLTFNQLEADELLGFVAEINKKIGPYRQKLVFQVRMIMGYIFGGIFFLAILAALLAFINPWLSLIVVALYFVGLVLVYRRTSRIQALMDKVIMFNLAVILQNLNSSALVKKHRLRAKIGHLAQWIEFHSLRPMQPPVPQGMEAREKNAKARTGLLENSEEFQNSNNNLNL